MQEGRKKNSAARTRAAAAAQTLHTLHHFWGIFPWSVPLGTLTVVMLLQDIRAPEDAPPWFQCSRVQIQNKRVTRASEGII